MAQYLQLKENELLEVVRKYDLESIGYEPIEEGAGNTSYFVRTSKKPYILTIFEIKKVRVANLCKLLNLLKEHQFPATRVVKMVNGGKITSIRGKPAIVKAFIPGKVVKKLDEDMIAQVGTEMGKLHQIPEPDYLPAQHAYGLETFPRIADQGIKVEYEQWLERSYHVLQKMIPAELPRGLIHGDVFFDNVLFEGKRLKAIIDFEEACNYYQVFDLGMAIVGLCTEMMKIRLSKVKSLVHGYQKIRKLNSQEKNALKLFTEYAAIATSAWRFWKYNIDNPNPEKMEKHQEMMDIAMNAKVLSNDVFIKAVFS
jgi:homoserine kinase type II